jgi:membrane protein YqaA with SNARE-associated domain
MRETLANLSIWLQNYGPWGIFALAFIDSAGVPLPTAADLMLLTIGITGLESAAYFAAFLAFIGSLFGNILLFQLVRQGKRLMTKEEAAPGRFQQWFRQYGLLTVFVPAVVPLLPLPLKIFVISAGALGTPFNRFVAVITTARVIRYFGLAYLALQLGADAEGFLRRNAWTMAGVIIAIAFVLVFVARRRQPGVGAA